MAKPGRREAVKAPLALESAGRNPTDRGKKRQQAKSVDRCEGCPPGHGDQWREHPGNVKLLAATLDAVAVERPGAEAVAQNLCLDAGYVGEIARCEIEERGYIPHVRPRGEEIEEMNKNPDFKPRRWVVEVCHSWFNRFRKLLVRYEKMDRSYLGLLMLAASIIVLRKIKRKNQGNIIYG